MFPTGLPEFFIRMLTSEKDIVLDPFCGSNATGYVAEQLGRCWLSIDKNYEYVKDSRFRWDNPPELTIIETQIQDEDKLGSIIE